MPSPAIYCTAAAMHTRRLRIGTMGNIVPLYDPLRIAEEPPFWITSPTAASN